MTAPAMALPADGQQLDVSLPADFQSEVRRRLGRLAEGSGPQLGVAVDVQRLRASRAGEVRHVEIELVVWIFVGDTPILSGSGTAYKELTGPAHDNTELDEMYRACALDAFDAVLASEANIATVNRILGGNTPSPRPRPPLNQPL